MSTATTETRQFEAEVQQVLDLMIHSLYSNKEIFLRELISNASDACDKLRFEALSNEGLLEGGGDFEIRVDFDSDNRTVSIQDSGIGMSRDEIIENIGTIARSGTRKFLEAMSGDQRSDSQLIGQFGVGFYSAFIVADKVTVETRRAGDDAEQGVRWESSGDGEYELSAIERSDRGTTVTLHLKEDESEFLQDYRLRSLIGKYSDHVAFPVLMKKPEPPAAEDEEDKKEDEEIIPEWEAVNQASALWTRPKNEISDEDYQEFYKHVSHDFNEAITWSHNRVEGNQSYTTLLYLPNKAPFDLMTGREERKGLKLYVRRVFIMDAAEQLLPTYLRFVRGVVDSDDLPLNVSREILQENKLVSKIRAAIVKRVLGMVEKLSEDSEKYAEFWKAFGEVLKEGPVEDFGNREKLLKLMRFASTKDGSADQTVSLEDYVGRMQAGQDKIYYITADSHQAASNSPHLEVFRKKGIEVLLMSDRVDEWMMSHVREFDGKPMQSISKGDLDLSNIGEDDDKSEEVKDEDHKDLLERMQKALDGRVESVSVSNRLTDSPSCLVLSEFEMAVHMQSLLKQAGHDTPGMSKPKLEINPKHALLQKAEGESDEERFSDICSVLFEQAWLAEGGQLEDPAGFVKRMNQLLT